MMLVTSRNYVVTSVLRRYLRTPLTVPPKLVLGIVRAMVASVSFTVSRVSRTVCTFRRVRFG